MARSKNFVEKICILSKTKFLYTQNRNRFLNELWSILTCSFPCLSTFTSWHIFGLTYCLSKICTMHFFSNIFYLLILYLSTPFSSPLHTFVDKRRDAKIFVHDVCIQSSLNQFSLSPPLRTLICFVYQCYIDPLPSAAAAAAATVNNRSIRYAVAYCYNKF